MDKKLETDTVTAPYVFRAIADVATEIAVTGIAKDKLNSIQKYKFRGIDDVYNAISPVIAKHRLIIIPRVIKRDFIERESKSGGAVFYVTVEVEFDFISAVDGSKYTAKTFGEAMDSADKATNKAMSAAYKYVAFQTFCIPTEGDNDADANHIEVKPKAKPEDKAKEAADGYINRIKAAENEAEIDAVLKEVDAKGALQKMFPELYQQVIDAALAKGEKLATKGA
jgi:hypothetical protein